MCSADILLLTVLSFKRTEVIYLTGDLNKTEKYKYLRTVLQNVTATFRYDIVRENQQLHVTHAETYLLFFVFSGFSSLTSYHPIVRSGITTMSERKLKEGMQNFQIMM